ncbi:dehydrogenase [Reticulibacter mediterranei]|uniref:Dehydrogenase n=1 Tax=Reticulibacter mediterranei TaxID=2778369 RepID=A0A8J3IZM4_9CHLR|nr:NAD(P)/FAD-dependent oxidoreductase [Reticulibacter mediterranei]GHO98166.1 dehydrogenase [Reticulibacter mediterranei]
MNTLRTDVVIVGGGMAGLTAASYLAQAGVAVTLFEKASKLGGRAATSLHDGYAFNRGIHALYTGDSAEDVLRELGIAYNGHSPKAIHIFYQGKLYPFPTGFSSLLNNRLFDIGDKLELMRMFTTLPRLKAQDFARMSVQEWIERTLKRTRTRQFMTTFASTNVYSAALDQVSAEVLVHKLQLSLKHPVLYIDGGWQTLVDGLRAKAEQAGARIVSGTRVEAVEYQDGQVQGVRLRNGSVVQASAAILATTPTEAVKLVDGGSYEPLRSIVDALIPAQVACLDVALRRLPDPSHAVVQDMERPRFFSTQSLYARVAPEGGALIHALKLLDFAHPTDPREDERDLENLLDSVQPDWRDELVKRIYLPRIEAIGMLPTTSAGGYAGRPTPIVPGITHLYLAGDWIGAGFLADPSLSSARQVARMLLQDEVFRARKGDAIMEKSM